MKQKVIALFGEAEKGRYESATFCRNIEDLLDQCGNPPPGTQGIFYAIQALLYEKKLLFFRVKEEGSHLEDYFSGISFLKKVEKEFKVDAIFTPGVGDSKMIHHLTPLCRRLDSLFIMNEPDFYDYMTDKRGLYV